MSFGQRLREARERAGKRQQELAEFLGVSRNAVTNWEAGSNAPEVSRVSAICTFLNVSAQELFSDDPSSSSVPLVSLPVLGEVRAGAWLELNDHQEIAEYVPVARQARFSHAKQYALRVVGRSMDKVVKPGSYVIVADWSQIGKLAPTDGDLVVVKRERGNTFETTLKRARLIDSQWQLVPESTDPKHQEAIAMSDGNSETTVGIVGLVIGIFENV